MLKTAVANRTDRFPDCAARGARGAIIALTGGFGRWINRCQRARHAVHLDPQRRRSRARRGADACQRACQKRRVLCASQTTNRQITAVASQRNGRTTKKRNGRHNKSPNHRKKWKTKVNSLRIANPTRPTKRLIGGKTEVRIPSHSQEIGSQNGIVIIQIGFQIIQVSRVRKAKPNRPKKRHSGLVRGAVHWSNLARKRRTTRTGYPSNAQIC